MRLFEWDQINWTELV